MNHLDAFHKSLIVAGALFMATLLPAAGSAPAASTLDTSPVRIAFNGNGDLLVTDYTYEQVLTVAPDTLDVVGALTINGRPLGVAWTNDLTYVGNCTTRQVEVYNTFGQQQFVLGFGDIPITAPQDIATGNGNVYVVDGDARNVKIFTQDGFFVSTIPRTGYDKDILTNPTAVTVDETNKIIFVSDYGDFGNDKTIHPRIQAFNLDGTLAYTINSGSSNKYRFTMPQGLTVNKNRLFVIDSNTSEIHVYDATNGALLSKMKGTGITSGALAMQLPLDLVIDSTTNNVFVTNNKMASINVFAGAGGI